jgi:hypothetical protein
MPRPFLQNIAALALMLAGGGVVISCGGGKANIPSLPIPNIAGPWQFVTVSNDGTVTAINVALKEGQVLVGQLEQPDGQISASSTQIAFVNLNPSNAHATGFGGACPAAAVAANGLGPGSITAFSAPITFTFTENGNLFNATATLAGDGQSILQGTYTPQNGNTCTDPGGTITGNVLSALTGLFSGTMCPLSTTAGSCQMSDTVNATLSENSSGTLTLELAFTAGPDAGTNFTMTGPVTGNAFLVQGTFQGNLISYYGYSEQLSAGSSLYFVNAADPCIGNPSVTCTEIGLLTIGQ